MRAGRHIVFEVIPGSAGAQAGIRIDDVLLTIDDRTADELTAVQLTSLLSADGATRRLVVDRDGRRITIVLRLKARI